MKATLLIVAVLGVALAASPAGAGGPLAESFEDITTLTPSGWFMQNNSVPPGTTAWFQGNTAVFSAHSLFGYIGANFNNTGPDTGTISNWLLTPELTFENGDSISFWTRVPTDSTFPDRLQVRMSSAGDSTDVGLLAEDVGVFDTLLLDINPTLAVGGYPDDWQEFNLTISGLGGPTAGRLAFRYFVEDGGPNGVNSNYIGIDTFSYDPVPAPAALALLGMAGLMRRRRRW